jgi:mRNA-degrading endonuclease RelE of RelBE toxin-antitoxin system
MQVIITPKAQKHFKKLPKPEQTKVKRKFKLLEDDPLSGKKLDGEFAELRSIRAWPYRIFYYLNAKEEKLFITSILHRQGAYK